MKKLALFLALVLMLTPMAVLAEGEAAQPEQIELTCFYNYPQGAEWKWGDDAITQYITEKYGYTVNFTFATTSDSMELNTSLASGMKLADFIFTNSRESTAINMISQGFVQPMNVLADEHNQEFWKWLPGKVFPSFKWEDGNLYYIPKYFGDEERGKELEYTACIPASHALYKPTYEAAGSPSMDSLEDFRSALKLIQEQNPDILYPVYDFGHESAVGDHNMLQQFYRIFGGDNVVWVDDAADTVTLCFKDPRYLEAAKYISSLYRDGLFNKDNFTVSYDEFKQLATNNQIFYLVGQWWTIASLFPNGGVDGDWVAAEWPEAPSVPRAEQKRRDEYTGAGYKDAIYISKDADGKKAIDYLTWLLSDEGETLFSWNAGIPEKHFTLEPGNGTIGVPTRTEYAKSLSGDEYNKEFGFGYPDWINSQFWNRACVPNWLIENPNGADEYLMANKYKSGELTQELLNIITEEDMKVLYAQLLELWDRTLPQLYCAESDEACEAAMNTLIQSAEGLGLAKLESYYLEKYHNYVAEDASFAVK